MIIEGGSTEGGVFPFLTEDSGTRKKQAGIHISQNITWTLGKHVGRSVSGTDARNGALQIIRGGFLEKVSRVWKEGRVLAHLKRNMKAVKCQTLARHFYDCLPLSSQPPGK